MRHLVIICDGMSDSPMPEIGELTPLAAADTPAMDSMAREGLCGMVATIPEGYEAGSDVANTAILGYNLSTSFDGRGPLEVAASGYDMLPTDLALRCNLITLSPDGRIADFDGGSLSPSETRAINAAINPLGMRLLPGADFRHNILIHHGSSQIICTPPHQCLQRSAPELLPCALTSEGESTADCLHRLFEISTHILNDHRALWAWGAGHRPNLPPLLSLHPSLHSAAVISGVSLIRGLGRLAGMKIISAVGATGNTNTNYSAKAEAAIEALDHHDLIYLHIEAPDEASHRGDYRLKIKAIEKIDRRVVAAVLNHLQTNHIRDVRVALLPDHPTITATRCHGDAPVPLAVWQYGIVPDGVDCYTEEACQAGSLGLIEAHDFIPTLLKML